MAPYAFLGRDFDGALMSMYTESSASDVFEVGYSGRDALLDSWPLARAIARRVTPELVTRIGAEHRRGRRLLVVTTNLDAERPVVWSLGALAQGDPNEAAALIQRVVLASASIPGLFPPVQIGSQVPGGSELIEVHGDGAASAPFFLLPEPVLSGVETSWRPGSDPCRPSRADIVINNRLSPEFDHTPSQAIPLLSRGASTLVKAFLRVSLDRAHRWATAADVDLSVTIIPADVQLLRRGPFDGQYMGDLYAVGKRLGASAVAGGNPRLVTGSAGPLEAAP
jgi:hypothetical protein